MFFKMVFLKMSQISRGACLKYHKIYIFGFYLPEAILNGFWQMKAEFTDFMSQK